MQAGVFAGSLLGALWFAAQDYTLVSAVFPIGAGWLVGPWLALGLAALGSAVFPRVTTQLAPTPPPTYARAHGEPEA